MTDRMTLAATIAGNAPANTINLPNGDSNRRNRSSKPRVSRKRTALVNTAMRLFYGEGYHAVGIDRILEEAKVSKPTLYAHFKSKDDLIVAALRQRDVEAREFFSERLRQHGGTVRAGLLYLFDLLGEWINSPEFKGCLFINASAEYAHHENPVHQAAAEHKLAFREMIANEAAAAGIADADALAGRLMLLVDGLVVTCQVLPNPNAVRIAKEMAGMLIDAARDCTAEA